MLKKKISHSSIETKNLQVTLDRLIRVVYSPWIRDGGDG